MNEQTAVLVIGDWDSWCGACGVQADPFEQRHSTVFRGPKAPDGGCGVVWTHVAAEVSSRMGVERRIREMCPDLACLPELVDRRDLPMREVSR